jgi:VWFA-related protein
MTLLKGVPMRSLRSGSALIFSGLMLAALAHCGHNFTGNAQTPPGQNAANATQTAPATDAQTPLVRATTKLVLLDVVVTDHDKAVHGLSQKQFHVFENGKERTIVSFDEHRAPAAGVDAKPIFKTANLPPNTYTNIPQYPESPALTVLVLDALNTPVSSQMDVRRRMIDYLGKIKPGTSLAIFTMSSRMRMITGFSTDLAALEQTMKSGKGAGGPSALLETQTLAQQTDATTGAIVGSQTGPNAAAAAAAAAGILPGATSSPMGAIAALRQFEADSLSFQTDLRVTMTLDAFQQLARYLSVIPGRKNVVWFSGSFPFVIDPDSSLYDSFRSMRNYREQVQATTQMLSDARIAVYPVDARGLAVPLQFNAANNTVPATNDLMKENSSRDAENTAMEQIAADTGGKAYLNHNDLMGALGDVVENGANYYTIGYQPTAEELDGQFHKFKVRLDDAKFKLIYRSGYYADAPDKPSEHHLAEPNAMTASFLHGAPIATQIAFDARVLPASDPLLQGAKLTSGPVGAMAATMKGPLRRYVIDLVVDLHGLAFKVTPDGTHQAYAQFAEVAYDKDGNTVNSLEHSFQLAIRADRYDSIMASGLPVRLELDLPEGRGSLRLAINDLQSDRTGSLEIPISVGAQ